MSIIYLTSKSISGHPSVNQQGGMTYEYGKNHLRSGDGPCPLARISPLRRTVSRRLQNPALLLARSISLHGLCPTDVPGKLARHRGLSESPVLQALSHGHSRGHLPKHAGVCQRASGLASLCRLCPRVDSAGQGAVCQRHVPHRLERDRLCPRLDHHRSVSVPVPVGPVSQTKRRDQAAHVARSARIDSLVYQDHPWKSPRRQHPRRVAPRTRVVLCHGSRLSGLRPVVCPPSTLGLLRHSSQNQPQVPKTLFASDRACYRRPLRSAYCADRVLCVKRYPEKLRRIRYVDAHTHKHVTFLCNNFTLAAQTIAELYRCRWKGELFFKWIKQHLRIKAFYGTSENAVRTQIWIAVSIYVLVAIVRKRLGLEASLYQILQILSVTLFEKVPILQALEASDSQDDLVGNPNQLILFEF